MQIPDEHIGIRLEDMILITDTGYENLSAFVPIEIDAIEREMKRPGLRKRHGAAPGTAAVEQVTPGTKPAARRCREVRWPRRRLHRAARNRRASQSIRQQSCGRPRTT